MDLDYRKPSSQLVFDLINRDNPQLPFPLTATNCLLGTPQVISSGFRNTQLSVTPKANSGYTGSFVVTYRRLDPYYLIPGGYPIIDQFATDDDYFDKPSNVIKSSTAFRWINEKYGTQFGQAEFDRVSVPNGVNKTAIANVPAGNLAWRGGIFWDRRLGKKPLDMQIPELANQLAVLSAGVIPGPASDNVADFLSFSADFSSFSDILATFTTLTTLPTTARMQQLIDYLADATGLPLLLGTPAATKYGMSGCRIIKYALPAPTTVPEANSVDYNNVAIITPPAAGGWFVGRFVLHYKV